MRPRPFIRSAELSQVARHFTEHGVYTLAPKGSRQWDEFWFEQRLRCLYGWTSPSGTSITGYHYHYLNFCPIDIVTEVTLPNGRKIKKRDESFPKFYDGDYDFFWAVEIARNGIDPEQYAQLNLGIEIHPDDLQGGLHLTVLKARRKGYSYKCASLLARNYYHVRGTANFVAAFDKGFLENNDGILTKCWNMLAHIDKHTPFQQPRLVDQPLNKLNGFKTNVNGTDIPDGYQCSINGIPTKEDVDKVRGKAGEVFLYEEAGKFPNLDAAWEITKPTLREGDAALGIGIIFGTGGSEGSDFVSLQDLFSDPVTNEMLRIRNIWTEGSEQEWCGLFIPIWMNLQGFIDADGNSLVEQAKQFEQAKRLTKKKGNNPSTYTRYCAEHPFEPSEAMLQSGYQRFPIKDIKDRLAKVRGSGRYGLAANGWFRRVDYRLKFDMDFDHLPVSKYPHGLKDDLHGCVQMWEPPVLVDGKVPDNMYFVCVDPFKQDDSQTMESLGAAYVIKRQSNLSDTYPNAPVASLVGRPPSMDAFHEQLFLLAEHYNAKIAFERNVGDILGYAKRTKRVGLLMPSTKINEAKATKVARIATHVVYGETMNDNKKSDAEIYLDDWLRTVVAVLEDGSQVRILDLIDDIGLLAELILYNGKRNADRVSALLIGMYYLKDMYDRKVSPPMVNPRSQDPFFSKQRYL